MWFSPIGWLDSLVPLLEFLIRERPPSWADTAAIPWSIWKLLVDAWPDGAFYKSPAIQRIAARMFVLIQSYVSAAADFLADGTRPDGVGGGNEVVGAAAGGSGSGRGSVGSGRGNAAGGRQRRGTGGRMGGGGSSQSSGSGRMIDLMPRILDRLMVCQGTMMSHLTYLGWPPAEVTRPTVRELYNHPAVIGAALQLIAAACVDMYGTFKQQQQQWRQQKAALKAAAAKGKKKLEGGGGVAAAAGGETALLKLNLPADHAEAGALAGWEQGLEPWRREDEVWLPGEDWTLAARFCQQGMVVLRNHCMTMLQPDSWEPATVVVMEKTSGDILLVHLAKLPVMKLLLEAVFLLQATAPGLGVHLELGRLLFMAVRDNPAAARELLRQRGLLLLQAMQLMDPDGDQDEEEEGRLLGSTRGKPKQMPGGGMDWLQSLVALAAGCSKLRGGGLKMREGAWG